MKWSNAVSVMYPEQPQHPSPVCMFAELVRNVGARRLWLGQSLRIETHQVVAYLAGAGLNVPVGTGVTLMPLRHPYEAAVDARSLAALTGHPVTAGFGASTPAFARALRGAPYDAPATAAGEYLATVRAALDEERPEMHGDYYSLLSPPRHTLDHPPVEVGAGVLRRNMAMVAGAAADVAITWLTPADYIGETIIPALEEGAGETRTPPRVTAVVHVALARKNRDFVRLARIATGGHLRGAHYTDMLRKAGLAVDERDPDKGAEELVRHGVFVTGTAEEIVGELERYRKQGVDEVVLHPGGVMFTEGVEAAVEDLEEILSVVTPDE